MKFPKFHYKMMIKLILSILIFLPGLLYLQPQNVQATTYQDTVCRFGITAPYPLNGLDISNIGVSSFLNWTVDPDPGMPANMNFVHILRVSDAEFQGYWNDLPANLVEYPGAIWEIGNEPDTTYDQDSITAAVYAQRFYNMAVYIRSHDANARILFGTIVQPTPIRIRYLTQAWNALVTLAGSVEKASALIDVWAIHAFILNEQPGEWGTGVPPGFENDHADAITISIPSQISQTYSINIFEANVQRMRNFMASIGERNKPLWITEYGSLFPSENYPGNNYYLVSQQDTAIFMINTFIYLLSATDSSIGLSSDGNHLVQKWYWWSLNDYLWDMGGSLFNPANNNAITTVGNYFVNFTQSTSAQPDLAPNTLKVYPSTTNGSGSANFLLLVQTSNSIIQDYCSGGTVSVYDGDPSSGGALIGATAIPAVQKSDGSTTVSVVWLNALPGSHHTVWVVVTPPSEVTDPNLANNKKSFSITLPNSIPEYLPVIRH
jgi:hypothetical protein